MPKFPNPIALEELREIKPELRKLPKNTLVWRIYSAGGKHPTSWNDFRYDGPLASRFDHHIEYKKNKVTRQSRGIMYGAVGAKAIPTCVAEVFQKRIIDPAAQDRALVAFKTSRALRLIDLSGPFSTKMGASAAINSGSKPRARVWARVLYEAYPKADGIYYSSSMYGNYPAIALFERSIDAIPELPEFGRSLSDPALRPSLMDIAENINYLLI